MKKLFLLALIFVFLSSCSVLLFKKNDFEQVSNNYKYSGLYLMDENGACVKMYNDSTKSFYIDTIPVVSYNEFTKMKKRRDKHFSDKYYIEATINKTAAQRFTKATKENVGKKIAIIINDKLLSAPVINSEITGRKVHISGLDKQLADKIIYQFKKNKVKACSKN